jgi:hypothetical protein
MLAVLLTLTFLAAAFLAGAVIAVSLAKGFAAASSLRGQLALCEQERWVTVRHQRAAPAKVLATARTNRTLRAAATAPMRSRQRAAA